MCWRGDGQARRADYEHSGRDQVAWVMLDFGAKGHGNLAELAALQRHVAGQLNRPAGRLIMIVKSAHIYQTERGYVLGVLADAGTAAGSGRPPDWRAG
jgi:hypothetical protein